MKKAKRALIAATTFVVALNVNGCVYGPPPTAIDDTQNISIFQDYKDVDFTIENVDAIGSMAEGSYFNREINIMFNLYDLKPVVVSDLDNVGESWNECVLRAVDESGSNTLEVKIGKIISEEETDDISAFNVAFKLGTNAVETDKYGSHEFAWFTKPEDAGDGVIKDKYYYVTVTGEDVVMFVFDFEDQDLQGNVLNSIRKFEA